MIHKFVVYTFTFAAIIGFSSLSFAQSTLQAQQATISADVRAGVDAGAEVEMSAVVGQPFVLNGDKSTDDGAVRTYTWTQISGPFKFDTRAGVSSTFTPQVPGTYEFEFVVTDDAGLSSVLQRVKVLVKATAANNQDTDGNGGLDRGSGIPIIGDDDRDLTLRSNAPTLIDGAAPVLVSGVEVRGWDPEKKEEFLKSVKASVEVRSGQELEHFAQGVLLRDENVSEITVNEEGVSISYRQPAKFLGIFKASLHAHTVFDAQGQVKVSFPWTRVLFRPSVSASTMEAEMRVKLEEMEGRFYLPEVDEVLVNRNSAQVIEVMVEVNKNHHDMAKSIIQNIRA
ncbi:MAG: hypothetical protein Q8P45_00390, partial [Candidatus Harrisonbacteria bacterium]|nr:hypothetical protein [Candidatus Harrisonbacteria bacterium]